jgi:hypothetical protein
VAKANNLSITQTPAVNDGAIKTLLSGSATDSVGNHYPGHFVTRPKDVIPFSFLWAISLFAVN